MIECVLIRIYECFSGGRVRSVRGSEFLDVVLFVGLGCVLLYLIGFVGEVNLMLG